jgi:Zn-dependent metalloprotease
VITRTIPAALPVVVQAKAAGSGSQFAKPVVRTYDFGGSDSDDERDAVLVRTNEGPPVADPVVNDAHDNSRIVLDFFQQVLGRDSIDGKGSPVDNYVHDGSYPGNAAWSGTSMRYGDGDGEFIGSLAGALDIVAHEMTHGVVEHEAGIRVGGEARGLTYRNQAGALNESYADVFGEIAEQWHEDKAGFGTVDAAKGAEWLMGEDAALPAFGGVMRSFAQPGKAFANDEYGADPQVGSMDDYVKTSRDYGGVHMNSGIPNRAAYEAALQIGSEKVAKIWYAALGDLRQDATFSEAAHAIVGSADKLYGSKVSQAVADAWKAVKVLK